MSFGPVKIKGKSQEERLMDWCDEYSEENDDSMSPISPKGNNQFKKTCVIINQIA